MFDEVESLREQTAVSMYAGENTEDETYNHFRRGLTRGKFARTQPFIDLVVSTYLDQAKHRRSTLVFCASTETAASLTESFKKAGTEARYVTGNTPKALRQSTIKDFKLGLFPVLVNCQVFTEGADMPAVSSINVSVHPH
jgi:superfamily II DNA or RNA helicase